MQKAHGCKQRRQKGREAQQPAPAPCGARVQPTKKSRAEQRHQRRQHGHIAAGYQRIAVPLDQQRPQPQPAQREERGVRHQRQQHDAGGVRQQEQRAKATHRLQHRFARGGIVDGLCGLMHLPEDQQPGQRRQARQHAKPHAPGRLLHQPGQGRAGKQHAQPAHPHGHPRHHGKPRRGKVARDEHGAHQKCGRAAHADQHLPQQHRAIARRQCRQHRARNGERKRHQQGAPHAVQVDADAHEQLHGAEGKRKRPGKHPQRLCRQPELGPQARRHDGRDGAKRLAQRKARHQRQQHGPCGAGGKKRWGRRRRGHGGGLQGRWRWRSEAALPRPSGPVRLPAEQNRRCRRRTGRCPQVGWFAGS